MAITGKIFYNAVRGMDREQIISYISKYAEEVELKVLLNTFDELRKGCVLNDEMNATLNEIENHLKENPITQPTPLNIRQTYLKKLEGRIKMLILSQHMAKNLKDKKRMFSNNQKITELFIEYNMEGGTRSFQSPC